MNDRDAIAESKISLPLIGAEESAPAWEGWTPIDLAPALDESPLPVAPQGEYSAGQAEPELELPAIDFVEKRPVELLAPAGGPDAAFAAFHFGADAVYLGLKKFSARAEAENFTLAELDEITAYAHSLTPRRRVFVTINTLIRQDEVGELIETLAALSDIGVDAIILQDLGVYHLARRYFPDLELHASTQLAVHNGAGAAILKDLGFSRVVLARELTFEEVRDITATAGIETEVFIHGALCYSYSGLCLFSSQSLGRSGNRGKCAYSCRDSYEVTGAPTTLRDGTSTKRDPGQGFPFSMKDLALPDHIPALQAAGVSCFKVEGRKKSPLYVATTTDYYRRLIDGRLSADERPDIEADLQTVFSRPWTRLFVQSFKDKEVADRDTVGHRGTPIGEVEAITRGGHADYRLRFHTRRTLQRHDGLQIDLPTQGRPFGFGIETLAIIERGKRREVYEAEAGSLVEVGLPEDHPTIPTRAPVYCSSSQEVKQRYEHSRPKPGKFQSRKGIHIEAALTPVAMRVTGRCDGETPLEVVRTLSGPFVPVKDPCAMDEAVKSAFTRLGSTHLLLEGLTFRNEHKLFVPVSKLNQLRRDLVADLEAALQNRQAERVAAIKHECMKSEPDAPAREPTSLARRARTSGFRWSIKVDRIDFLDAFTDEDCSDLDEVLIDIARDHPARLTETLQAWGERLGRDRIRLALPPLTRSWEEKGIRQKIRNQRAAGWNKWEVANLSGWSYLECSPHAAPAELDVATDWSVYVINRLAAQQLLDMGVSRFTLSPEDGIDNMRALLADFSDRAGVIVYQDTPQFLAESCAYANLIGGCPGKANCKFESMEMVSSHGEKVTALDYHCRTIVLNQGPFCLSERLDELRRAGAMCLRADFIYRQYTPEQVRDLWRLIRAGRPVPAGHAANFERGIL